MRTNEEMLYEIETANDGQGPTPFATYDGTALNDIMDAVSIRETLESRITAAVERARNEGATWAMIGQALGVTRQGALKHYRQPVAV